VLSEVLSKTLKNEKNEKKVRKKRPSKVSRQLSAKNSEGGIVLPRAASPDKGKADS